MIHFKLTELNREINKIRNVKDSGKYQSILDDLFLDIAKGIEKDLRKKFIKRSDYPSAPTVKSIKKSVHFSLPPALAIPHIGKRTGKLEKSISIKHGRYYRTESVSRGGRARFSYIIDWDKNIAPYVEIQEYGGVVKARKGKYLTIPLQRESWGKSPLEFVDTVASKRFIFKKLGRKLFLPLYLLKKSVRIPPHYFIRTTVREFNIDKFINRFKLQIRNLF